MNIYKHSSRLLGSVALIAILSLNASCETDYIDRVNNIPGDVIQVPGYTHIESFSFAGPDEGQTIKAAITENEIIVLWSAYNPLPETITPSIILGDGATIAPVSDTAVPFTNGTVFTVTSEAGTTKEYTLKIDLRQVEPTYTQIGNSAYVLGDLQKEINIGTSGQGAIDNLLLDISQTRVYFVSAADQTTEFDAEVVFMGLGQVPYDNYGIYYFLPDDMPAGMYDIRIQNGKYLIMNPEGSQFQNEVRLPDAFSVTRYGFPANLSAGQTIEARGAMLDQTTSVEIYNSNNDPVITYPLEIVSVSPYRITLKVPAGTPAGSYNRMRFHRGEESTLTANAITVQ
ncbi:MAG: hypothetical protein DI539_10990 [Flavobacterium psychrophilum]|nr:MAG: hypothetical protein DI539_10990 [Flavobacterium psychrophilum]